jgi:hypothetical protein
VAAGAPSHFHHAIGIGDAAADQLVDAGHDVEVRVLEIVSDHVAQERVAIAGAAAVVRLQADVALPASTWISYDIDPMLYLSAACGPPCVITANGYFCPA